MTGPTATFAIAATTTATWTATDGGSGVAASSVRWERASATGGPFSPWVYPSSWAVVGGHSVTLLAALGYRYCFAVRATDLGGNVSGWSAARCTTTPYDERSLTSSSGWTRGAPTGWIARTSTTTKARGASLTATRSTPLRQVGILGTSCPTCGSVAVYVGATKVGTLSLVSSTTVARRLVTLPRFAAVRTGIVRFVVVSTGRTVTLDAWVATAF